LAAGSVVDPALALRSTIRSLSTTDREPGTGRLSWTNLMLKAAKRHSMMPARLEAPRSRHRLTGEESVINLNCRMWRRPLPSASATA